MDSKNSDKPYSYYLLECTDVFWVTMTVVYLIFQSYATFVGLKLSKVLER